MPAVVGVLTSLVVIAAVLVVVLAYFRGDDGRERTITAFAAAVAGYVAFFKVFSPQYLTWLIPLVPLVWGRWGRIATPIFLLNPGREIIIEPGQTRVKCSIDSLPLPRGRYYLWGGIYRNWTQGEELIGWQPFSEFDLYGPELDAAPRAVVRLSPLHIDSNWMIERT